jgi:polyhydroxyalkanoate synthesis regulator phasin
VPERPRASEDRGVTDALRDAVERTLSVAGDPARARSAAISGERAAQLLDEVARRGREARGGLARRGRGARQELARRGQEARDELSRRSGAAGAELARRGQGARDELSRRGGEAGAELARRGQEAREEVASRLEALERRLASVEDALRRRPNPKPED